MANLNDLTNFIAYLVSISYYYVLFFFLSLLITWGIRKLLYWMLIRKGQLYHSLAGHRGYIFSILHVIISFLFLSFAIHLFAKENINTYYYTLSSIIQGFLTLAALLGSVIIFKIQLIEDKKKRSLEDLKDVLIYAGSISPSDPSDEIEKAAGKYVEECKNVDWSSRGVKGQKICELHSRIQSYKNYLEFINKDFGFLILWIFITVGFAFIVMPFLPVMLGVPYIYFGSFLFLIALDLSIISLFISFQIIQRSIRLE